MKARAMLLAVVAAVAGCASGPKYAEIKNTIPALSPENGRIYFYRPSAMGAAVQPNILLNGSVVGEMVPQGFFFVDRAPGNYVVSAKTESEATLPLTLLANQTRYVKGGITLGFFVGRPELTLVDATNALIELQDLSYIGTVMLGTGPPAAPTPAAAAAGPPSGEAVRLKDLEGLLPEPGKERR